MTAILIWADGPKLVQIGLSFAYAEKRGQSGLAQNQ